MEQPNAGILAAIASAAAANRALIRLHALLAAKGVLGNAEIEGLRHLHLHDFDQLFGSTDDQAVRERVARDRDLFEADWQKAMQVPWPKP